MSSADPFGTASVRERVLAAWAASPARLREDANAEEDLRLGGYRDRVVVELAQNAADAAAATGLPGRLRLSLDVSAEDGAVLAAANTGAPLDAGGVIGLATLRASAKRDDPTRSVGRYGVGFAAVLALTDEPILLSHSGSVRFSRADTAELVGQLDSAEIREELRRRDGQVPVLRLPFEAQGDPPDGFSTVVILPLRDSSAEDLARRLLAEVDDALLLALPGLAEIEIDVDGQRRVLAAAQARWWTLARSGAWSPAEQSALLADRPVEEAARPWWSVQWALPRHPGGDRPAVVHAPTPTDEPLAWPALLLASFPLDPSRRHIAPGPLTDRIVLEAAAAYAALLAERAAADPADEGPTILALVPTGLGAGAVDSALREATLRVLRSTPILAPVEGGPLLRPTEATTIDGPAGHDPDALAALAPYLGGLVAAPVSGRTALRALGVRALSLSDIVEALPHAQDPAGWRERYDTLAPLALDPAGAEALGVLPVPLADGRVVRGPRGLLLPGGGMPAESLAELAAAGVRIVHPDADHPLLGRLGAVPASARQILEDPAVRELVDGSPESDDPQAVAATVLSLVAAALQDGELRPGELAWLGDLALLDTDGELAPASALAVPGSVAETVFDPDEIGGVAAEVLEQWGSDVLSASGVLTGFALVLAEDVDLADPEDSLLDLDGFEEWAVGAGRHVDGAVAGEIRAVRDLDAVRSDRWPDAVLTLVASPATRQALVDPVRLRDPRGRGGDVPSYTAWWLRRELALDGQVDPAGAVALGGLLDPAPEWVGRLDDEVRRALGVVRTIDDLGADARSIVLQRLSDPDRVVDGSLLIQLWGWLARLADTSEADAAAPGAEPAAPEWVRALTPSGVAVVAARDAIVVDSPMWLQRTDIGAQVVAPRGLGDALADQLDLALAREIAAGVVTSTGAAEAVPPVVAAVLPSSAASWCRHDPLLVDGVAVSWWVDADGGAHASDHRGLACALAWSSGRWSDRAVVAELLDGPDRADDILARASFRE